MIIVLGECKFQIGDIVYYTGAINYIGQNGGRIKYGDKVTIIDIEESDILPFSFVRVENNGVQIESWFSENSFKSASL